MLGVVRLMVRTLKNVTVRMKIIRCQVALTSQKSD